MWIFSSFYEIIPVYYFLLCTNKLNYVLFKYINIPSAAIIYHILRTVTNLRVTAHYRGKNIKQARFCVNPWWTEGHVQGEVFSKTRPFPVLPGAPPPTIGASYVPSLKKTAWASFETPVSSQ